MATVNYPSNLPAPLQQGYGQEVASGFLQSNVQAGPPINYRVSRDNLVTYTLTWQLDAESGEASYFWQWGESQLDGWTKPFNMDLLVSSGLQEQEVWFANGSKPQLVSTNAGAVTYSATVFAREIKDPFNGQFETLEWFAVRAPDGDPFTGMAILDRAITESAPEA